MKAGNISENLLNEIRQIMHSLYQEKENREKVYNNIIKSRKLYNSMDIIFMNSENGTYLILRD